MSIRKFQDWYFRGWEYQESVEPGGRSGGRLVYTGEYYSFGVSGDKLRRLKKRYALLTAALLLCYVLCSLDTPTGSRSLWGGACILTIIPLMYLLMGISCLLRAKPKMTYRDRHLSWFRIHYSSMAAALLLAIAAAGEAIYILRLATPPAADIRWLAGQLLSLILSLAILIISCRFPPKMITPELT